MGHPYDRWELINLVHEQRGRWLWTSKPYIPLQTMRMCGITSLSLETAVPWIKKKVKREASARFLSCISRQLTPLCHTDQWTHAGRRSWQPQRSRRGPCPKHRKRSKNGKAGVSLNRHYQSTAPNMVHCWCPQKHDGQSLKWFTSQFPNICSKVTDSWLCKT